MLFNSIDFAVFLPIVFALYWFVCQRNLKVQNLLIVVSSYIFYGWWDWRFLTLVLFSTLTDFFIGLSLKNQENPEKRRFILWLSIIINLGFLGFFKYANFFLESFAEAFSLFGQKINPGMLNIILPVGISFYTFQTLSYTIDVYRRKLEPTDDIIAFASFVSFFPQLVAGPIERASNLLPQFYRKRHFDYLAATDGLRQMLWGLFKKVVIADNCGEFANTIFNHSEAYTGSTLMMGAVFFAFQIYGDFSGYSDIAIGTARLFGFSLMKNFDFPYFSRDIAEFWRRWHISLSTWFRDYLYIPLGGSRGDIRMAIRNTFIIFVVSGFWHGANWTFIVWGGLNALYFLPLLLRQKNRAHLDIVAKGRLLPRPGEAVQIALTFTLCTLAWVFFRAESLSHAFGYLGGIFSRTFFSVPDFPGTAKAFTTILLLGFFLMMEWLGRENNYAIEKTGFRKRRIFRWSFYAFLLFLTGMYMQSKESPFIYFQF